jgi:putative hemolysin
LRYAQANGTEAVTTLSNAAAAREISYSFSARTRLGAAVIRSIENMTGRPRLIRMATGYDAEVAAGRDFWAVMAERYRLRMTVTDADIARIPRQGPLVVVANHPFGILDGLALGRILSMARGDFRIVAHQVFHRAPDLRRMILPIDFSETRAAQAVNLETRKTAMAYLGQGGCVGIFPGGTVSTGRTWRSPALDPAWRTFTAKMAGKPGVAVLPIHFDGQNSRLFQIASHLSPTLRVALLIKEFGRRLGDELRVTIGAPLPAEEIAARRGDPRALMDWLRAETYRLSPTPLADAGYGHDFG